MKAVGYRVFAVALIAVAAWPRTTAAGAWAQAPGHYYAKLSGIAYGADEVYDDMGERQTMGMDGDQFTGRQAFLYVEYGLREGLTLVTQMSAGILTDENRFVRMATTGIADVDLGVKYQILDRPFALAPMLAVKVPTGYGTDYEPPLGTGAADAEARALLSRSLDPWPVYVSLDAGFRARGGAYSNQLCWGLEVGATPHRRLFAKLLMSSTSTLAGRLPNPGLVGVSTQVSEGDHAKVGVDVAVQVGRGLWVDGLLERVVRGQNIGAGTSWGLGLAVAR